MKEKSTCYNCGLNRVIFAKNVCRKCFNNIYSIYNNRVLKEEYLKIKASELTDKQWAIIYLATNLKIKTKHISNALCISQRYVNQVLDKFTLKCDDKGNIKP